MSLNLNKFLINLKLFLYRITNFSGPKYPYMLNPKQLSLLIEEIDKLQDSECSVIEIGVFRGMTTRFLSEHINNLGIHNITYWAIDTFNSFKEKDIKFEEEERGKDRSLMENSFLINDFEAFKRNFQNFPFVKTVQADCTEIDYTIMIPIKLVLIDVDLYMPVKTTLEKIYPLMEEGGTILIDDVKKEKLWDGSYQAYMEFCEEKSINPQIYADKFGVIRT